MITIHKVGCFQIKPDLGNILYTVLCWCKCLKLSFKRQLWLKETPVRKNRTVKTSNAVLRTYLSCILGLETIHVYSHFDCPCPFHLRLSLPFQNAVIFFLNSHFRNLDFFFIIIFNTQVISMICTLLCLHFSKVRVSLSECLPPWEQEHNYCNLFEACYTAFKVTLSPSTPRVLLEVLEIDLCHQNCGILKGKDLGCNMIFAI